MRYIKFYGATPFCGTDFEDYEEFEDDTTDEYLNEEAASRAYDNGGMYENIETDYSICREDYDSEEEYESAFSDASDEYYAECTGDWEEVSYEEFLENA